MLGSSVELLSQGGFVVSVLGAMSVVALAVILLKSFQFMVNRWSGDAQIEEFIQALQSGDRSKALKSLEAHKDDRAALLSQTLTLADAQSVDLSVVKVESIRLARAAIDKLSGFLRVLEVIATTAPLLGLFGTVLGMIEAFQALEAAGSQVNPSILSGGIWQALLTTAVGLAVAIPVSMVHSWFERRVELRAATLQNDIDRTFLILSATPLMQPAHRAKAA
ncbi:MotA/TolQ/ExbB proton channel family protein [Ketobacter sp. MCCC 1A13808]|uniref:MotA/TolQ/ExbB proton channel family protein n=1 Tax=Ketobacter sp. MCCC 1A13808 TaxID=2602738 RepID=UPI000F234957|nr:MotA/TolQ/ExbB proton channel family protein [Ketobacter sp. MCCC 1A13808]MVF14733.1 MotA/TolQ/ExbB proton channel family protein [Ketobacter sp. MCCC 1A13808]RLP55923.1 MAG: MotA/TolQ/ExbB proton channel family protein [Ketobacter sp.]